MPHDLQFGGFRKPRPVRPQEVPGDVQLRGRIGGLRESAAPITGFLEDQLVQVVFHVSRIPQSADTLMPSARNAAS